MMHGRRDDNHQDRIERMIIIKRECKNIQRIHDSFEKESKCISYVQDQLSRTQFKNNQVDIIKKLKNEEDTKSFTQTCLRSQTRKDRKMTIHHIYL